MGGDPPTESLTCAQLADRLLEDDRVLPLGPWSRPEVSPPAGAVDIAGSVCLCIFLCPEGDPPQVGPWCPAHDHVAEFVPLDVADWIIRMRGDLAEIAGRLLSAACDAARLVDLERVLVEVVAERDAAVAECGRLRAGIERLRDEYGYSDFVDEILALLDRRPPAGPR